MPSLLRNVQPNVKTYNIISFANYRYPSSHVASEYVTRDRRVSSRQRKEPGMGRAHPLAPTRKSQVAARMNIRLHQLAHQNLRNSHYLTSTNHRPDRSTYNKIRKHSSSCQLRQLVTSHSQCHKAGSPSPAATLTRTQTVFKCIAPNALEALEAVSHLKDLAGPLPMHPETRS